MQSSGEIRREIAEPYPRHCERSEAIHCHLIRGKMDCFASLAMTTQNPRETATRIINEAKVVNRLHVRLY
ncbi:hypothetical protein V1294_003897 [Bradyrhizobium sp. AZCC 1678]|uniref:BON domain-containing protein n=1 Tax=Bradyrhizobium algeriense TaxID=634784 RepID=A0ABU8BBZ2_9BRAD